MKLSARNMLKGKGKSVTPGVVSTEVLIEILNGPVMENRHTAPS